MAGKPTVVFIHQFGGNAASTRRHQDLVSALGFPFVTFTLSRGDRPGQISRWKRELVLELAKIDGPIIMYTLSFPSCLVPAVKSAHPHLEIVAWICDGGPFIDVWHCLWNYFTHHTPVHSLAKRFGVTSLSYAILGGPLFPMWVAGWLKDWNPQTPVLSIRSLQDRLVPESAIDNFFALNPALKPLVVRVDGDHLEGAKVSSEPYRAAVAKFLEDYI